jgi:hypothetical protein
MRAALILLALGVLLGPGAQAALAAPQYPDLQTLPPRDLRFDRTDVSVNGSGDLRNVLRFSNTVTNQGDGRLLLRGTFGADTSQAPAVQHIYDQSGADVESHQVGTYIWHEAHQHYHFDDWGRYELWTKAKYDSWVAQGRPAAMAPDLAGSKTTSCVMDEEFISTRADTPWPGVFPASGCSLNGNGVMTQGLSVGWGDTYDYWRQEQWIDLGQTKLADGDYVLRSVTDPFNRVYESAGKADPTREDPTVNEALTPFRVSGGVLVDSDRPSGSVWANGVNPSTTSSQVTVRAVGRDDVSGIDQVRVSNDGLTWKTYPYGGEGSTPMTIAWDLADTRYGGSTAGGARTVYAQFHDFSGKWSATVTDAIDFSGGSGSTPPPAPSSPYGDAVLADAPVSWWRLGEASGSIAADARGANDGSYAAGTTQGAAGLLGSDADKAARFDGAGAHVTTGSTGLAPGTAFSLEAWIRPEALPAAGSFASIATRAESYSLQFNGPRLEWTVIQNGARRRLQAPAGAVAAGQTYHVVGTYDGTTQRLYIDGVQVATIGLTGAAGAGSGFEIGSWDGGSEFFKGTIDEVAFYDKALPGLQVKKHHDTGVATSVGVATPSGLSAAAGGTDRINLAWTDNATNETGYVVQRASSADFSGATSTSLPAGSTSFASTGLSAGTAYWYRVQAIGASDSSAWSNTATATTQAATTPPPPPPPPPDGGTGGGTTTPPSSTSYRATVLSDGPLSYWRLDETSGTTAKDENAAHAGTYRNAPALGAATLLGHGDAGRAVRLDGTNDYVSVPNAADLSFATAFTLEAWVRPAFLPASGSFASVVSKPEAYSLQFNGGRMEFTVIQSGARRRLQAPAGAVAAGATAHVVGTYDGATQRLYVNGKLVASRAQTGRASAVTYGLSIGSWNGGGEFLGGLVDDVAVYAKTLPAARVLAHFDAGAPSSTAALRRVSSTPSPRKRTKPAQDRTRRAIARKKTAHWQRVRAHLASADADVQLACPLERRDRERLERQKPRWKRT